MVPFGPGGVSPRPSARHLFRCGTEAQSAGTERRYFRMRGAYDCTIGEGKIPFHLTHKNREKLPYGEQLSSYFFNFLNSANFFLCTQAVQAHPFGLARKDGKCAQGGAVNSRREGHLIAPPCTSWHFPSSKQRPIGKDILMDEKARESNLSRIRHGQDLKNPIECAPKRENTLFRIKDSVNFFERPQAGRNLKNPIECVPKGE
jgi:hypothetical protein